MNREGHNGARLFLGTEIEHSPALGKRTLFVVGTTTVEEIDQVLKDSFAQINGPIEHIYFGANHSFPSGHELNYDTWTPWENMILPFIDRGMLCTLDFDVSCAEWVLDACLEEYNNFIPMISVRLPYISMLNRNYNTTIKLDDKDFDASNPGVWCHSLHSLMDRRVFTNWTQYTKDTVIK